jgi:UDP-galactopyranose mutase
MKYNFLIVGAGLFGSVLARELTDGGFKVLVIEKRAHIGGNVYTEKVEGINVHKYGPHILHTDNEEVWNYLNRFTKFKNFINSPIANYNDNLYPLPFNMNTFEKMWGVTDPERARRIIDSQKFNGTPKNLEEQALSLVGKDIYEKLIKGYTEKQWGKKCTELPPEIIKRLPVRYTYDNNYYNSKYQGIPEDGYTAMFENMLSGIDVILKTDYFDNRKFWNSKATTVIYTGPIDKFYDFSLGTLEYRSLQFETEILNIPDFQKVAVMNFTNSKIPYTRICEHKHFEHSQSNKTVVTFEYPKKWKFGDEPYYPINDTKNSKLYQEYKKLADSEKNVIFGGRLAEYKYYDMDKIVERALDMSKIINNSYVYND